MTTLRRLIYSTPIARALALVALLYSAYYLFWRGSHSLNLGALWFALPLLVAEAHGYLNFAFFTFMSWDVTPASSRPAPLGRTVDILIATYNEDLSLLKVTILGALNVRYPHETWVLDDGRRPEVQKLCAEMGAHYLTRPDNRHGKAGNINAALARTSGEFVAIFDADQVPLPGFLDQTLGYLTDPRVAFVQTPQEFYNLDSMQHHTDWQGGATWHEQSLFYRVIQAGKNRWDATFWCGSNSVMRRTALDDVGGIATGSVTEDIHTSLRVHAAGWKSVYHDEVLAMGLAPQDFVAFTVQRLRWAQGSMQILRRENPLFKAGLSLAQRLNYVASMTTYLEAFQRLIYTVAPAVVLVSAVMPIRASMSGLTVRFIPYFALGLLANLVLGRGHFKPIETERYNLLKMATFIRATVTLIGFEPKRFKVTPKAGGAARRVIAQIAWPYFTLGFILVAGMLVGGLRLGGLLGGSAGHADALIICEGWAAYNLWVIVHGLRVVMGHVTRRNTYRFRVHVPATVRLHQRVLNGLTADLHEGGLSLLTGEQLPVQRDTAVMLQLPGGAATGTLAVRSSRRASAEDGGALWCSGGLFTPHSAADATAINAFLIGVMAHQLDVRTPDAGRAQALEIVA